jgi:hypothetical protein
MADINLKTETPDTTLPTTGFLFGADSQAAASPSVYTTQAVATTLLGSTTLTGQTITASAPVLDASQTWNNGAVTFTGLKFNATDTASAAASLLMDLQVGGISQFQITKAGRINGPSGANVNINGAVEIFTSQVRIASTLQFFTDTILTRRGAANLRFGAADAAAPVAQTLSVQSVVAGTTNTAGADFTITGSQGTGTGAGGSIIFQVAPAGTTGTVQNALSPLLEMTSARDILWYNSFTNNSNYERLQLTFSGGAYRFITQAAGTGTTRNLVFQASGGGAVNIQGGTASSSIRIYTGGASERWAFTSSGHFIANGDNNYDIGTSSANRPRDLFLSRNLVQVGAYHEMAEMTAPAAPAADGVRIYAVDNGSGKTQLMALFATGAAQQIAIEP